MPPSNIDYSKISPDHFFANESEKTKLNWFAFELAREVDHVVPYKFKKYLAKRGCTKETFNMSCVKLAGLLQKEAVNSLSSGNTMCLSYEAIEKAFNKPKLNKKAINDLLSCVQSAWDNLLRMCVSCPSACVSNKDDYCEMFNDKMYYK
ncbi:MAG: hypothetical protein HOL17_00035 [Gammaproteobacteria bacterium]|nr:hypothetical protein [Gammaproteobacteria bacterium]MBT5370093.1 hypothetical protein [Gammaproteobacteria bacterium]MBT5467834.1 hypothetical protein [Candidatus Neomarinimicrobiota bacterium]MBT5747527.1 hypothetical protein [Gammaproteobacteria bacterium]MBT7831634.1 hypothetical protein [Candidatus Neomarinimicrobiota bacterium]